MNYIVENGSDAVFSYLENGSVVGSDSRWSGKRDIKINYPVILDNLDGPLVKFIQFLVDGDEGSEKYTILTAFSNNIRKVEEQSEQC